jgi:hypothetical protein
MWPGLFDSLRAIGASDGHSDGSVGMAVLFLGHAPVLALGAIAVLWAAPLLARRLLPPTDPPLPLPEEALRGGVCLLGVWWLCMVPALLLGAAIALARIADAGQAVLVVQGVSSLVAAVLAIVFALWPRKVAAVAGRLSGGPPRNLVAAGLCVIAARWTAHTLPRGAGAVAYSLGTHPADGLTVDLQRLWYTSWLVNCGATLVLAGLLVWLCGGIASRFGVRPEGQGEPVDGPRLGGTAVLALAVQVGIAYIFCAHLRSLMGSPASTWYWGDYVGGVLCLLVVLPLLAVILFWVAGRLSWAVGSWLHKPSSPDDESAEPPTHVLPPARSWCRGRWGFARRPCSPRWRRSPCSCSRATWHA